MTPVALRPAADTSFALMDDRPVLFSQSNQQIYELDRVGAYIWCKLLEHEEIETILDRLAGAGLDRPEAGQRMRQALQQWLDLALVEFDWELSTVFALRTRLARHAISIHASNEQLLNRLTPLFCSIDRATGQGDVLVELTEFDDKMLFRINKAGTYRCERDELAPAIKASLVEHILRQGEDLAVHAASLIWHHEGLLLCGRPGAGKSTLALHLADGGFQYAGDDLVLIGPDGATEGIPFAPTIKPGSWDLISKLGRDLGEAAVYCRRDGIRVRYVPVAHEYSGRFSVGWIVFLNRVDGASAEMKPLGQIETMRRIFAGSFAANGRLSRATFDALKGALARAKSFELTYSDVVQARGTLMDLCHGRS